METVSCHHHRLNHVTPGQEESPKLMLVFGLTSFYFVIEVIGGLVTHSLALLADAAHMFTDMGALGIALFAIKLAKRPANAQRTWGYLRAEILAALANTFVLIGVSFLILYEAFQRFKDPVSIRSTPMLLVAVVGLGVNVLGAWIIHDSSARSLNVRGAYYEVLVDLFSSVGVIVAAIIIANTGWYYADPLISAAIGLFILPGAWMLLRETVGILLEGTPSEINLFRVQDRLKSIDGILDIHDLHVWSLTSGVNALSAHIVLPDHLPNNHILSKIRQRMQSEFKIERVTIQIEHPGMIDCPDSKYWKTSEVKIEDLPQ